ncbi:MAG TPA: dihydroorotate dehydrogenase electron transfer subunit [Thermoplasmata archaeon]|nr:dihydroorotate dehydrogenase electron transfer subunit [Thermoplasmata archaeon]
MRSVVPIVERVRETPSTVTLRFDYEPAARPGQFVMLWIPGDDEIPMSLSYVDGSRKGVTVKAMGATSRHVLDLAPGDRIGVRGPYGNVFDLSPRRLLVVGGGSGAAVLAPAVEAAEVLGAQIVVALGAVTARELLFEERFRRSGASVHVATDDGSVGVRGFVTEVVREQLRQHPFDAVWTCGPEAMMARVVHEAGSHRVPAVLAMERHMKCALGMCDACAIGPFHVCVDGPVFPAERIMALPEFGTFQRDASGRRAPVGRPAAPPAVPRGA